MKQVNLGKLSAIILFLLTLNLSAHEGHEIPGSLPPAPHGGKIAEATHLDKHAEEKEDADLFLEAKLEGSKLKVYPMLLESSNTKIFKPLTPSSKLSIIDIKLELPRSKKMMPLSATAMSDSWESDIGTVKEKRLLVHATFNDSNEKKIVKIQLEK